MKKSLLMAIFLLGLGLLLLPQARACSLANNDFSWYGGGNFCLDLHSSSQWGNNCNQSVHNFCGFNFDRDRCGWDCGDKPNCSPVPEPSTMALLGIGLLSVVGVRKKLKRQV